MPLRPSHRLHPSLPLPPLPQLPNALRTRTRARSFTTTPNAPSYADTIPSLKIGAHTRVIYQGFTGRVSTTNAQQSLAYGTNIVGGTTPGKSGEHLGLPLLPSVRAAAEALRPDASAVFVAAQHAAGAIEDAIAAEIPLIVAVAEFIPLHDILRLFQILNTQSKSRLVGANSPGIIAPLGRCRIGFQPLPCYLPGHVGVVAKSGTLSYEAVGSLTRAGVGQSLCIGMGGDIVAGTNMVEALTMFEHDEDTEAIILVGEVGGRAELDAAEWVRDYRGRVKDPKPIAGVVGGVRAQAGRIMGHAGAFASLGEAPAEAKAKALADAGVTMVDHPSQFGRVMKQLLAQSGRGVEKTNASAAGVASQKRGYHTSRRIIRRPGLNESAVMELSRSFTYQKRHLHYEDTQAKKMLRDMGIAVSDSSSTERDRRFLAVTVNRSNRCPAIVASPTADPDQIYRRSKSWDYDYQAGPTNSISDSVMSHLQMEAAPPAAKTAVGKLLKTLVDIFKSKEAYALETHLVGTDDGSMQVDYAKFSFDDSAPKSAKRQGDVHSQRDMSRTDPDEVSVEKDGIVYVKLDDPQANIGTLINGAGLAMNANDALTLRGARPTNFLDTGGKATSETVKKSFEVILKDPRVKVIFVNIFGGLTLCDMIAEGIMMAFKDLEMKTPVVVRLRGTNEEIGQKMIAESGLPLHAFDDFGEAADKCKELANSAS